MRKARPAIAGRMRAKLLGQLPSRVPVVPSTKVDARAVRARYQSLVDERRSRQQLHEEVTDLLADSLCVCPTNLAEQ